MIAASRESVEVWNRLQPGERARTLAATRFIDFPDGPQDDDWRRRTSEAIRRGKSQSTEKLSSWRSFALGMAGGNPSSATLLFAALQSRLLINMACGVFENGGICLDHASGVPFIPGSAAKGCARRIAIQELRELAFDATPADFKRSAALLVSICLVFGWGNTDWQEDKSGKQEFYSDFAYACGRSWREVRQAAAAALCERLGIAPDKFDFPWESLPHSAGGIAFLPAYPWEKDPGIDLDVITGHHSAYYKGDIPVALDTEDPVPVVFPAISATGNPVFAFLLHPTSRGDAASLDKARCWLAKGLETFGLGAKTNAGYGWFIEDTEFASKLKEREAEKKRSAEESMAKAQAERKRLEKAELDKTLASLPPEVRDDARVAKLSDDQFHDWLRRFVKAKGGLTEPEKAAVVRALRGPRISTWQAFKLKAQKGGEPATIDQAIRALNKRLNGDKMP
jgi:CRISPR-associated protein Cmr6